MIWTKQVRYQWVMERLHGLHRSAIKSLDEHLRDAARGEFVRRLALLACLSLVGVTGWPRRSRRWAAGCAMADNTITGTEARTRYLKAVQRRTGHNAGDSVLLVDSSNAKWCMKCGLEGLFKRVKVCPNCGGTTFCLYNDGEGVTDEERERADKVAATRRARAKDDGPVVPVEKVVHRPVTAACYEGTCRHLRGGR